MNLSIRTLVVRISTANGVVGTRLDFDQRLNVIHAPNTMGKSICVNAIIYALGLEGMLSASHEPPFPSAMTDSIIVGEESLAVLSSEVLLEVVNEAGEAATIRRSVAGKESKNLVSVWNKLTVSEPEEAAVQKDYFVRVAELLSERLASITGWQTSSGGSCRWSKPSTTTRSRSTSNAYSRYASSNRSVGGPAFSPESRRTSAFETRPNVASSFFWHWTPTRTRSPDSAFARNSPAYEPSGRIPLPLFPLRRGRSTV